MCIVSEEQHFFGAPPLWQAWWTAAGHRRDAPSPLTLAPDSGCGLCGLCSGERIRTDIAIY